MGYKFPWSNFHELNLDWILEKIKEMETKIDAITGSATPSSSIPQMDGAGSAGISDNYSRGDHQHPTDTSRAAQADLAQEVIDRGNADNTLQTNINTVDAKIKFSAAAPIMDSSSASAGFSDFLARADHIHPTDTSRASATDVATLKARMDAFSGSANPSDVTPVMDGVGTPGDVGAYSRGNHQHPSDTSKLDKAGGTITGDLTIQGTFTETRRRQYITTNAIGWLRAIQAPLLDGTRIDIVVVRKGTVAPSEVHKVTYVYNQSGPAFLAEWSLGDVVYIDKIRITDAGRIDIHMDQTAESQICVYIDAAAPTDPAFMNIRALEIEGVADAPAGETVLLTHAFSADTIIDISSAFSLNTNIAGITGYVSAIFDASTQTVDVSFAVYSSATISTTTPIVICTNSRYSPKSGSGGNGMIHNQSSGEWYPYNVAIDTSGNIIQSQTGNADRVYGRIKYKV